jgi:hypothetical protein
VLPAEEIAGVSQIYRRARRHVAVPAGRTLRQKIAVAQAEK